LSNSGDDVKEFR